MTDTPDKPLLEKLPLYTAFSGMAAFAIIITGALLSAWFYSGRTNEPYSFLNHFVSELGNKNYSGHAYFFNDGMLLAGIPVIVYMVGISTLLQSRLKYALLFSGILSGMFCILLGYYSSDRFDMHFKMAVGQFNSMLLSAMFFSAAVLREKGESYFPRWLAYLGALPGSCILLFLSVEYTHHQDFKNGHIHQLLYNRPAFWPLPFMEWMVLFSLIGWVALICGYLMYAPSTRNQL